MTLSTGYWLVRSLRVGVEVTSEVVAVRRQLRTRRFGPEDIRGARVAPLRTASPFYRFFPYVALEVDLRDRGTRHSGRSCPALATASRYLEASRPA